MKPIHCRVAYFTEYIPTTLCSTMIRKIMQIFALKRMKKSNVASPTMQCDLLK